MSEPITLEELLADDDVEWVIFHDGDEEKTFENFGTAVDTVIEASNREVGVIQSTGIGGMGQQVYLSVSGVVEELLNNQEVDEHVVDIRFTLEGFSASVYGENNQVVDESWFTWDEVDELKSDEESHVTFEIPGSSPNDDEVTVKRGLLREAINSIEGNMLTETGEQKKAVRKMEEALNE